MPTIYTTPVRALVLQIIQTGTANVTGLNRIAGVADGTPICDDKDASAVLFGVSLERWNIVGLRAALTLFGGLPDALKSTSIVLLEGWSTNYVTTVPEASTAYPDRFNQVLMSPYIMYALPPPPTLKEQRVLSDHEVLDDEAIAEYGSRIRNALLIGSGRRHYAYVNYTHGDESLEALYGYDAWRLRKLRKLKAEYDPENRFRYYIPIVPHA